MKIKCYECGTEVEIDEQEYPHECVQTIECPLCSEKLSFTIHNEKELPAKQPVKIAQKENDDRDPVKTNEANPTPSVSPSTHPNAPSEPTIQYIYEESSNTWKWFLAIGFVLFIIVAGYFYKQRTQTYKEKAMWESIKESDELSDFENYLRLYPNGQHIAEIKKRQEYVREEIEHWNRIANSDNIYELEAFYKKYPKGRFHNMAIDRYDDLLWDDAIAKNTLEAYNRYIAACPQGKHYGEARDKADYQEKLKISDNEAYSIESCIKQFFYSLAQEEEDVVLECLDAKLEYFLGKTNASKMDALSYMRALHSNDVKSVDITMGNIEMEKSLNDNNQPEYVANFTFDQRLNREDISLETFASFNGTAHLNHLGKITYLALDKMSQY